MMIMEELVISINRMEFGYMLGGAIIIEHEPGHAVACHRAGTLWNN